MEHIASILLVVDRNARGAAQALQKAIALARQFEARLELFLCDAERAYQLEQEYDSRGVEEARLACLGESRRHLEQLRDASGAKDLDIAIDVTCESPLYESIVHKVRRCHPDLVIRCTAANGDADGRLGITDWEIIRTVPVPLLLVRTKPWNKPLRIAAAVDVSSEEAPELGRMILKGAQCLLPDDESTIEVLYGDPDGETVERQRAALRQRADEAEVCVAQLHVLPGEPAATLPPFAAARQFDVMVLGALTHHKAKIGLVGTLTGKLLDSLECDFLLVKPKGYVCPVPHWRTLRGSAPASSGLQGVK